MSDRLDESAREGRILIFAGAGLSAGPPSSLPGWYRLNEQIMTALRMRLEAGLARESWLADVVSNVSTLRTAGRFPPDYQAQLIEEMCGERYFRALQSLDVDVVNSGHRRIAALAAGGAVSAIVTTNFDRLTEHALQQRGVAFEVAFEDESFQRLGERLAAGIAGPLPVIKIHGCVSAHKSMIDTLKQRKLGRSRAVQNCLDPLFGEYWLYLGFSAEDLETDRNYLGLIERSAHSAGAMYVRYPGAPALSKGAEELQKAYGERWADAIVEIDEQLGKLCALLGIEAPSVLREGVPGGAVKVEEGLARWASGLSLAATGLCLGATLEAAGETEAAARLLDRLVRKDDIRDERGTRDFQALQLHCGRLGAGFGRFANVPDLNGAESNASMESEQSLMRLKDTKYQFAGTAWIGCLSLWWNRGDLATQIADWILVAFHDDNWRGLAPRTDEEAVDAWLSASLVFILNTHKSTIQTVIETFPTALQRARRSGDAVRTARAIALYLVACAEMPKEVPEIATKFDSEFGDACRVGDGFALGFRKLALGRWYVGPGGIALAQRTGERQAIAEQALAHINEAASVFQKQGLDPWALFTALQRAKALMDLSLFDELQLCMDNLRNDVDRFPIFASHLYETAWQIQRVHGNPEAEENYRKAVQFAGGSGLALRKELLEKIGAKLGITLHCCPAKLFSRRITNTNSVG